MARLKGNVLLPILVGLVLLTLGGIAAKSLFSNDTVTPRPRASLPAPTDQPDGDTPADTIRTLSAKLEAVNHNLETVVDQNTKLQEDNRKLRDNEKRLRADIAADLEQKLQIERQEQSSLVDTSVNRLGEQLKALQSSLTANKTPVLDQADDYPVTGALGAHAGLGDQAYVWVQPLDADPSGLSSLGTDAADRSIGDLLPNTFSPPADGSAFASDQGQPAPVKPHFTINNLATLAGSTAFTALIGRVPIGGQVSDPVPFRVLVGRENLAASGHRVPDEIASMVFEGVAIGDWTLGCVEGSLRTATFIFEDGTIHTVNGDGQGGRLGYIADKFGTPCVAGEKVSNAGPYLTAAVGLAAGAGAAEAFSASETAQVIDDGAVVSSVVGNAANFALGRAASEGLGEIQQYLAARLKSTFDVVFVPPGAEISLLIQQEISIDYDPSGRRLDHAQDRPRRSGTLD